MIFDGAGAAMALSDVCAGRGRNEGRREGGVKRDRPMYLEKGVPKIWGEVVFVCLHSRGPYKEGEREGGREGGSKEASQMKGSDKMKKVNTHSFTRQWCRGTQTRQIEREN